MKTLLASLVCSTAFLLSGAARAHDLNALLQQALADKSVPAMAILVIRDGKIDAQAQAGVRANDGHDAVRADDVWNIGSDGKAMTVTLIARLVERGVLSWDAPLSDMLPALAGGMRAEYRDVNLMDLLSHRAGLPPNPDEAWINSTYTDPRPLPLLRLEYAQRALADAPVAAPRGESHYSNSGAMITAAIAERITGKTYEELMQAEVFGPLGMRAAFGPTVRGQNLGHKEGKPIAGLMASNPLMMAPDGEIHLSMQDWAKFALDQLHGEQGKGKLLKRETYVLLHTAQGDTHAALGWGVMHFPPQAPQRVLTHLGSNGYWHALIALAPGSGDGLLIAANAGEGSSAQASQQQMAKTIMAGFGKAEK